MKKIFLFIWLGLFLLTGCATAPVQHHVTLPGSQGNLSTVLYTPSGKKTYPLVIILHGFNASKEMYLLSDLSKQLNEQAIATLLFDFNGHGASGGSFLDMTVFNELEDARRVYAYAAQLPGVSSISLVGHSQGGVVAAILAGELGVDKIKSLVLMAPAPELKEDTAKGNLFGVTYNSKNPPEYITLSNGLKVGRAYLESTPYIPIYEMAPFYTGSVMVLHSQDDELVPYKYGQQMSQLYKNARLQTLQGFDHCFTQDTPAANKIVTRFFTQQLQSK